MSKKKFCGSLPSFPVGSLRASVPSWLRASILCLAVSGCIQQQQIISQQELRTVQAVTLSEMPRKSPVVKLPATNPTTLPTTKPAAQVKISLEEAREIALEYNLDLKVELYNPTITHQAITEEEARFEALFTTDAHLDRIDQPTASTLNPSESQDIGVTPGVQVPLRTGGTVNLALPIDRFKDNSTFSTLNPAWSSQALFSLTQPLLRNAGTVASEHGIRIANYQYKDVQAQTRLQVIQVIADVERLYWRLYASREALIVRKQEYDLAVAQLKRAQHQLAAGTVAEVEVVTAESGVADAVEAVIVAENDVQQRERDLKRILNKPDLDVSTPTIVIPSTEPRTLYTKVDRETLANQAMRDRMEMIEIQIRIAEASDDVAFARNQVLPLLSLNYTYGISGLGPSVDDALTMVRTKDYENHLVALHLEIPIGNQAARSRLRLALLQRQQQLATHQQQALQIRQEIYNAADNLDTNWERIMAARQRVIAAARRVESETRAFTNGMRTSTDVLIAQDSLAAARLSEISALSDYQISQVDIAFATGTILGESKVKWAPAPEPKE